VLTSATAVAIIDKDDDEDGDVVHPLPSRISSAGNNETLLNPTTVLPVVPVLSVAAATAAGEEEQSVVHLRQGPPDVILEQPLKLAHRLLRRQSRVQRIHRPRHQEDEVIIKYCGYHQRCR
jgi:hypothetical protein